MKLSNLLVFLAVAITIFSPVILGLVLGHFLLNIPLFQNQEHLQLYLIGGLIITILFLLGILAWSIYKDSLWEGIMHPMAYMGSIVMCVLSIFFIISLSQQNQLLADGERIISKVENIATYVEYDFDTDTGTQVYELTYTVPLEGGKNKKIKKRVGENLGKKLHKEDDIAVIYLPQNPTFSSPVDEINPRKQGRLALGFLLAIYLSFAEVLLIDFFWEKGLDKLDR